MFQYWAYLENTYLSDGNRAKAVELSNQFAFCILLFSSTFLSLERTYPANKCHGSFKTFDVELVFECERDSMQRTNGFLILLEIFVKLLGSFKCNIEGDFEKDVWLAECYVRLFVEQRCSLTSWCAYAARFEYAVTTFTAVREPLLVRSTISRTSSLVMDSVSSSKRSSMNCPAILRVAWLFLTTDLGKIQSFGILSIFWRLFSEAISFHDWFPGRKLS